MPTSKSLTRTVLAGLLLLPAAPALALNILLCNDDGLAAANVRALKQKLVAAGHKVVAGLPLDNQSGKGGAVDFLRPIPAVGGSERGARYLGLAAGAPAVGADPADADVHYVNASPVAACLYGIDVLAPRAFGGAPDLVVSGPNEGSNTGLINLSSGTVNNMLMAVNRGLAAIAFSDMVPTQVAWSASLPRAHRAFELAEVALRVIDTVLAQRPQGGGPLLPVGLGLNVNIPKFEAGQGAGLKFAVTHVGRATDYMPAFYEQLSDSKLARRFLGARAKAVPGVSVDAAGTTLPSGVLLPVDDDADAEQNRLLTGVVTISPVEGVLQARPAFEAAIKASFEALTR